MDATLAGPRAPINAAAERLRTAARDRVPPLRDLIDPDVSQPDFGVLFDDMAYASGAELPTGRLRQSRAEAEIAFVLGSVTATFSALEGRS